MPIQGFTRAAALDAGAGALQLDPSQRRVVELSDTANAAILGAPGTGKTATLIEVVADRVRERGWSADDILILTPTRATATRLRDSVSRRIGVPTNGPLARTVNSLAFELVRRNTTATGAVPPRLLTGGEQDQLIRDLLDGHEQDGTGLLWPEPLTPDVRALRGFRSELRELMTRVTDAGIDSAQLAELGASTGHEEWVSAARFIREYQQVVDQFPDSNFLDAAELVAEASRLIRDGAVALERRLVLIDDFQEATASTIVLLRAFAARGIPILAFGDPDVAANTFRGATVGALARLAIELELDPTLVETFALDVSHRGRPAIRELTSRVTERIGVAGAGAHRRATAGGDDSDPRSPIVQIIAPSPSEEFARVARCLRDARLNHSTPWSSMLVVVRSSALVPSVARALAAAEVPARTLTGGRAIRDEYAARQLLLAASIALDPASLTPDVASELLLGPLGGLDSVGLRRLRLALRQEELAGGGSRASDELIVEALTSEGYLVTIQTPSTRSAAALAMNLRIASKLAAGDATIEEIVWSLWEGSGLARRWGEAALGVGLAAEEANRNLDGVVALFTAAKRFVEREPQSSPSTFIRNLQEAEVPEDTLAPQPLSEAVLVCTPSGSIGLEVDVVVVAGLQETVWPNLRTRGTLLHPQDLADAVRGLEPVALDTRAEVMSDELRMFALAVSRARSQVILSATSNADEQESPFLRLAFASAEEVVTDNAVERHPLTLRGMVGFLRRELNSRGTPEAASALARLAREDVPGADPSSWYGMLDPSTTEPLVDLTEPDATAKVSPSGLDTIEKSSLAWFIDSMSARSSGLAAAIGIVLHAVMETVSANPEGDVSVQSVWTEVAARWSELSFESPWVEERERLRTRRAAEGLSEYLEDFVAERGELLSAEGGFSFTVGHAKVNGKIDRIERTADGAIVIVDLKTGRSFPSAAELAVHAQLGAYQLAVVDGALPDAAESGPRGGAKLVFVATGRGGRLYREDVQPPLGDNELEILRTRLNAAAEAISGSVFIGRLDLGERDPHAAYEYRIHLIPAVSA